MESILAQNEDVLVEPLNFSLGNAASYIVSREQQTFFSSQNLVSPSSVRVAKFQLGSNPSPSWMRQVCILDSI